MLEHLIYGFPSTVEVAGQKLAINTNWRASACLSFDESRYSGAELTTFILHLYFGQPDKGGLLPELVMEHQKESLEAALEWRAGAFSCMDYGAHKQVAQSRRTFSLDADIAIIVADFQHFYHIDLTAESIHWYRFVMLLMALMRTSESLVSQATSARMPIPSEAKGDERKRLKRLQQAWALPPTQNEVLEMLKKKF